MNNKAVKRLFRIVLLVCAVILSALLFAGCASGDDVDTSGMLLVVYHGNGGFLGNKTATERKLFCQPGSKIPNYPVDYKTSEYTVPSLGLAMRSGYDLLGWYTSENADYTQSETGHYVYLSVEDGCGVYEDDPAGVFVRKYVPSESGRYVHVYLEEQPAAGEGEENPPKGYVLIVPHFDDDGKPTLGVEPGFYVCGGPEDWSEISDDALREAYEEAFNAKNYSETEAKALSGWQIYEDLGESVRTLFEDFERYDYVFTEADESDEGLDRYALDSGYVSLYDLFVEDRNGAYVEASGDFVKAGGDEPEETVRYAVADRYVFDKDTTVGIARYDISVQYWSFSEDRVTEDKCVLEGDRYVLHLYAHWDSKYTVYYHYNNGTTQVEPSTRRLLEDNTTSVDLRPGDVIGHRESIPLYAGHTFICWSKSETEKDPWDFENEVFPLGERELHLYAYYIEGEYERIESAKGLSKIGKNPSGKYLITTDIDLKGESFSGSPFGLTDQQTFTGEIRSFGSKISGFSLKLAPVKAQTLDPDRVVFTSLIPKASGAKIEGLNVEFSVICSKLAGFGSAELSLGCSGLIGEVLSGSSNTVIGNCSVKLTLASRSETEFANTSSYSYKFSVCDLVFKGDAYTAEGCASEILTDALTGAAAKTEVTKQAK